MVDLPGKGIMYPFDEVEVTDRVSSQCRGKWHSKVLELLQILAKVNSFDIIDNVQKCHTSTGIASRLFGNQ